MAHERTRLDPWLWVLTAALTACGGASKTSSDGGTDAAADAAADAVLGEAATDAPPAEAGSCPDPATAESLCMAQQQRAACNDLSIDMDACVQRECCFMRYLRSGAAAAIANCLSNLSCDDTDESCYHATGLGLSLRPIDQTYKDTCLDKHQQCTSMLGTDPFPMLLCDQSILSLLVEDKVMEAINCLEQPCEEVSNCLNRVLFSIDETCAADSS